MKAYIRPLDGKYYGTEVAYLDENGHEHAIVVWDTTGYVPSTREINKWGSIEAVNEDAEFSHLETERSYEIAKRIVSALNGFYPSGWEAKGRK